MIGITHDNIAGAGVVRETHTTTVILQPNGQKLHRRADIAIANLATWIRIQEVTKLSLINTFQVGSHGAQMPPSVLWDSLQLFTVPSFGTP